MTDTLSICLMTMTIKLSPADLTDEALNRLNYHNARWLSGEAYTKELAADRDVWRARAGVARQGGDLSFARYADGVASDFVFLASMAGEGYRITLAE